MEWLTKKEAQNFLGISTIALERRMSAGKIKYYKDGDHRQSRVLFDKKDLIDYINSIRK